MPQQRRVAAQQEIRSPKRRVVPGRPDKGAFFPGEVARMLGIEEIDNQRLRRIFDLVRHQRGFPPPRRGEWARFDYIDIACTVEVLRICADTDRLAASNFRLALVHIRHACDELRAAGLTNPLLQARIDLYGKRAVATLGGATFDVASGQQLLIGVIDRGSAFMARLRGEQASPELVARIEEERELVQDQSAGEFEGRFDPAGPAHARRNGIDPFMVRVPPRERKSR